MLVSLFVMVITIVLTNITIPQRVISIPTDNISLFVMVISIASDAGNALLRQKMRAKD
jgi:hypothetical protein